jgi:signal transduction histidine kinase
MATTLLPEAPAGPGARAVAAADWERRRLERNLHDGAQQRLVALSMQLGLLSRRVEPGSEVEQMLRAARRELTESLQELRELARGLHPGVLCDHGLGVALESLAARCPVPVRVDVDVDADERPPLSVEVAAYYVVSEALTNVAKYAQAGGVRVHVGQRGNQLVVEVADDGVGGADASGGTGLRGLADRVEALGGTLVVVSPLGAGTVLRAELPAR